MEKYPIRKVAVTWRHVQKGQDLRAYTRNTSVTFNGVEGPLEKRKGDAKGEKTR